MSNIGERLYEVRKRKKLTQQEFADELGCSRQTISCYEKNENLDKVYDFLEVCERLGEDADYIITGKKSNNGKEITPEEKKILSSYKNLTDSDRRVVDFVLGIGEYDTNKVVQFPKYVGDSNHLYVCPQKASAGIGKIKDESNPDLRLIYFEDSAIPNGTTHGIIIDGHSMEDKFFDKQIVFIQNGLECAPSDYGIFSVTDDHLNTKIYCKQLMQREDGSKYLHSMNGAEGDPDIDYKNAINIHCIGRILS